jgi:tetratricopeptide (TPR) repeat protein
MKLFSTFLIFLLSISYLIGQDFKTQFDNSCQERDTTKQLEILKRWEKNDSKNPELFTSYFNYYFLQSKKEVIAMQTDKPAGDSFAIKDSTGNSIGYLGNDTYYDTKIFELGIDKINQGISLYPNRLDMRFGKIYAYGQIKDWQKFTNEIIKSVKHSNENDNQWTWTLNEKKENGKDFFLSAIQDYQLNLYNTGNDDLLKNMRNIAEEILKYYPQHVESLSNLSITYLLTGEYNKGIEPLLKAEKINPEDVIVLSNIAHGYKLKGDFKTAIKYYEKVIKYGDNNSINFASQQIEELKK